MYAFVSVHVRTRYSYVFVFPFHHRPVTDNVFLAPPPPTPITRSTHSVSVGGVRNARGVDGFRDGPDGFGDGVGISDGFDRRYGSAGGRAVGSMSRAKLKAKGLFLRILEALPFQKLKILIGEWPVVCVCGGEGVGGVLFAEAFFWSYDGFGYRVTRQDNPPPRTNFKAEFLDNGE